MATATQLRKGMAIRHNGEVAVIMDYTHRTPGNLRAFVQTQLRSLRTGKSFEVRFSTSENIDIVPMETRKLEYSYRDGTDFAFYDPDTFETINLSAEIVGNASDYMPENTPVDVVFVEGNPVMIEMPAHAVLEVTESPEGVKGDSTTNVMKPVTVETGITVQAPLFIKLGEKIKVDTRTGKYMERVND